MYASLILDFYRKGAAGRFVYSCASPLVAKQRQKQIITFRRDYRKLGEDSIIKMLNSVVVSVQGNDIVFYPRDF